MKGWSVAEIFTFVESDDTKVKKKHLNFCEFAHNSIRDKISIHAHIVGNNLVDLPTNS